MMQIQTELEDLSPVRKRLTVSIPAETALQEFDRVAQTYRSRARIPGFRAGKAPMGLVKRHYLTSIRNDVVRNLVPRSCEQALREKEVAPLREPTLDPVDFREGDPLEYVAEFEVLPEVRLGQYKGLEISSPPAQVSDKDVEEHLQKLRQANSQLEAVEDRTIDLEDFAVIDLKGEYLQEEDAAPVEPIQKEDVVVEVGAENTHKAFTRALVGMNIAEEKEFDVEYPADYPDRKLAGKKVRFTIEVTDIKKRVLPDLDDEFARQAGDYEALEDLKADLRAQLQTRHEQRRDTELKNKLIEKLIAATGFEVPTALVEEQVDRRLRELVGQMAAQGTNPLYANLDWNKLRQDFRPGAEQQVRAELILAEIVRREGLEASDEEAGQEVLRIAEASDQAPERVRQHFEDSRRMEGLKAEIRRRKALDLLVENARVS